MMCARVRAVRVRAALTCACRRGPPHRVVLTEVFPLLREVLERKLREYVVLDEVLGGEHAVDESQRLVLSVLVENCLLEALYALLLLD